MAFGNSTESHDNAKFDVECPSCGDQVTVCFAVDISLQSDGTMLLAHRIIGAPVAEHVAERHPELLD
jgi:hypothetical protein